MSSLVWVELDAHSPDHNLDEVRRSGDFKGLHCAVVKSNAYGHGVGEILPLLTKADWLAVNSLEEGLELRGMGEQRPVLVMGHVPLHRIKEAREADLRIIVCNLETLKVVRELPLSRKGKKIHLHIKVETGTWRQGVLPDVVVSVAREISGMSGAVLDGIYTHFANIEDTLSHQYAEMQLNAFQKVLDALQKEELTPPVIHTACTAAAILFPKSPLQI